MSRINVVLFILALAVTACQPRHAETPFVSSPTASPFPSPSSVPSLEPGQVLPTNTIAPPPRTFTEGFDQNPGYWEFLQIDHGQGSSYPSPQDGFLVFNLPFPNDWVYALYNGQDYENVMIDARVEVRAGVDGAYGIVCRYKEKMGWYELNIYADQTYEILYGQWLTRGVARYTPVVQSQSEKISPGVNEIGLLCQGNTLTPYINGVRMQTRNETKFALDSGEIGLSASSFESLPFTVAYDSVKVSEP